MPRRVAGSTPACIGNCVLFYMFERCFLQYSSVCLSDNQQEVEKGQLSRHLVKVYTAFPHSMSRPVIAIGFATSQQAEAACIAKFMLPVGNTPCFNKGANSS